MNPSLAAPGTTRSVSASSALVLAPHFDDEVLGCGGLVAQLVAAGSVVRVLFLSDGGGGPGEEDSAAYRRRRREEAARAAEVLGLSGRDHLDLPDGALDRHLEAMAEAIRRALFSFKPELVLVTSPLEASPDHRAAFQALHDVLATLRGEQQRALAELDVLAYEVNHPLYPNLLVDVSGEVPVLEEAMACYASQQERHDYLAARLGLLRFRALTLPPDVAAVEAYRRLAPEDFLTRGPAALITELGGTPRRLEIREGPKISVVVRTRDRPELLAEALDSLAASTYRPAEVVVVNDGGEPPTLPSEYPLELHLVDLEDHRGRSAAANGGVAAANGEFVAFLDDDDLVEAEHLATLAGAVSAAGVRVVYSDAAVGVYRLDEGGWRCVERRLPYSRDFDPDLLLFDNYIPFNTLLFERRLFDEVGELDTGLPFFEDWDFLIRLAAHTRFHHLARVTCEYRQFRGAGHHVLGDQPRQRADFLDMKARVLEKHAARRGHEVTARVIDLLRGETVAEHEETNRLRRGLRAEEERYHELNGQLQSIEIHLRTLEESRGRAAAELEQERREHRRLDREVDRLTQREKQLEAEVSDLSREARRLQGREAALTEEAAGLTREVTRLHGEVDRLDAEVLKQSEEWGERLEHELATAHSAHGDTTERLRLMSEQEARVAAELRQTYAEIERLGAVVRGMESTRAWRLHQWWQRRKP